jgi:hypothetical protein
LRLRLIMSNKRPRNSWPNGLMTGDNANPARFPVPDCARRFSFYGPVAGAWSVGWAQGSGAAVQLFYSFPGGATVSVPILNGQIPAGANTLVFASATNASAWVAWEE